MYVIALGLYLVGLVVLFALRSWMQSRSTGSSGFHGISGRPGSPGWWGGVLFVAAMVLGLLAPALAVVGLVEPSEALTNRVVQLVGLVVAVVGLVATLGAQSGMGSSWRIGVDENERTRLVTGGLFAYVRNPIFTFMGTAQLGILLVVPTWISLLAVVALVVAVELQVRAVEEPYLTRTHGQAYLSYAFRTGRFLPGVGKLPSGGRDKAGTITT